MNKRQLNRELLHSGRYRQQVVKSKKGKGSFVRRPKHSKSAYRGAFSFLSIF